MFLGLTSGFAVTRLCVRERKDPGLGFYMVAEPCGAQVLEV